MRAQGDVDAEVIRKSLEEIGAGWLHGSFQPNDLKPDALISRRFGLQQGTGDDTKVRLIDDMSASLVNSAMQVCESPQPHTIDMLGCLLLECLDNSFLYRACFNPFYGPLKFLLCLLGIKYQKGSNGWALELSRCSAWPGFLLPRGA